jgi:release factor glutamine methyltransferase
MIFEPNTRLSLGEAVVRADDILRAAGCDSPRLDAELLLASSLGITRSQLHLRWHDIMTPVLVNAFSSNVYRRQQREPLAYILKRRAFYDTELEVDPSTLIPRPETELLAQEAIAWCQRRGEQQLWAADVGTGSGALAIALARHVPWLQVCAIDRSEAAVVVAERNVKRYGLQNRVRLSVGDLLEGVQCEFDVIVANLPYIPSARLAELAPEVSRYEPQHALDGGESGIDIIARMCQQVPKCLKQPGLLLLEIDGGQGGRVKSLLSNVLPLAEVRVLQDYAGLERIVRAELVTSF